MRPLTTIVALHPQRIGDLVPLGEGLGLAVLREDGADHGRDRGALLGRRVAQEVASPVHAAALEAGAKDAPSRRPQALVIVGNDELDAAQAAIGQRAEEPGPEHLGFRGASRDAQNLAAAVGVDADSDYGGDTDDPAALSRFQVGGVDPEVGPTALDRPAEEGLHALVDVFA